MKIYTTYIPPEQIVFKAAQSVPPQMVIENINIYEEALPYIECQMRNTIRHEAGHRADQEAGRPEGMSPEEWMSESRVEPIAEKEEKEDCEALRPDEVLSVITVNTDEIFQKAKMESGITPSYLSDVKAVILPEEVLGMFIMRDAPGEENVAYGADGSQYINVGNFFRPWLAEQREQALPPNIQDDGMESDPDLHRIPGGAMPSVPPSPTGQPSQAVPTVPSWETR